MSEWATTQEAAFCGGEATPPVSDWRRARDLASLFAERVCRFCHDVEQPKYDGYRVADLLRDSNLPRRLSSTARNAPYLDPTEAVRALVAEGFFDWHLSRAGWVIHDNAFRDRLLSELRCHVIAMGLWVENNDSIVQLLSLMLDNERITSWLREQQDNQSLRGLDIPSWILTHVESQFRAEAHPMVDQPVCQDRGLIQRVADLEAEVAILQAHVANLLD